MEVKKRAEIIQKWIDDYCNSVPFELKTLVVGVSGGDDS
jgi:NH3-dependent NAD+ synthetase